MKLFKSHARLRIKNSLSWNSLPDKVVAANTIGSFKSKLDEYWKLKGYGYEQRLIAYY